MEATKGSSSRAYAVGMGWEEVLGRDVKGPGSFMAGGKWTGPAESARPQLSLRLAKLLRLSGEGRRDGELGVPGLVADVGMSSMADEEEDWVWSVSTDIWRGCHRREGRK
jgi:hypothetical protein